jgi:prephenate dehydrogenase
MVLIKIQIPVNYSLKNNIIDKRFNPDSLIDFDYIFLAIPVESIKKQLKIILDKISKETLVIDLGSTKYQICNSVKTHNNRSNFFSCSPYSWYRVFWTFSSSERFI